MERRTIVAALKYSRQRESIKEFLRHRHDHPTADTVYLNIKKIYPNISLGTVYRNLALLTDIGEITKFTTGDGADRFDGKTTPHNHFLCTSCHEIYDLEMEDISHINQIAGKNFAGRIEGHTTQFYGTCDTCMKRS